MILSIDQAEELFLAEAQDEAQPFLAVLRDLLTDDAPAIIAVFTIRSDKYERTATRQRTGWFAAGHLQPAADAEGLLCGGDQGTGAPVGWDGAHTRNRGLPGRCVADRH